MKFGGEEINKNMDEYKKKLQFEISTNEKNEKKGGCC